MLLHDADPLPSSPSPAEVALADRLGPEGIRAIDEAILHARCDRFLKVARIVLDSLTHAVLACVAMLIMTACTRNARPVSVQRDVPATASVDDRVLLAACPADMRIVSASRVHVNGREVDCAELALTSSESTSGALITVECGRALKQSRGNAGACMDRAFPSMAIDMTMPTQPSTPSEPRCVVEIAVSDDGAVSVGGRAAHPGQSGLINAMRALCSAENARVVITSSRDVPYGHLVEVLDAARAAGFGMISFRSARAVP